MKKILLPILCLFIYTCDSDNPAAPIHGCLDSQACNYNEDATIDNNSCTYADEGYDCEGSCTLEFDCSGECGGTAVVDCAGTCDGTSVVDNCEVCAGDNSSCSDCEGTPNGTAVIDVCSQCVEPLNSCDELILGTWNYLNEGYDENDNLTNSSIIDPIVYSFDNNGFISITDGAGGSGTLLYQFSYDNPWLEYNPLFSLSWGASFMNIDESYPYLIKSSTFEPQYHMYVYKILSFNDNQIQLYFDNENRSDCLWNNYMCSGYRIITLTRVD